MLTRIMNCLANIMKLIWSFLLRQFQKRIKKIQFWWIHRESSILYQSLKVGAVLLLLLFFLFITKPQKASFFSTAETNEFVISNGKAEKLDISTSYLAFSTVHTCIFGSLDVPYILIDGKKYTRYINGHYSSGGFTLLPTKGGGQICIMTNEYDSSIQYKNMDEIAFNSIKCIKNGDIEYLPKPYWYYSTNKDGMNTEWDIDKWGGITVASEKSFSIIIKGFDVRVGGVDEVDEKTGEIIESDVQLQLNYDKAEMGEIKIEYPSGGYIYTIGAIVEEDKENYPFVQNIRVFSPKINRAEISDINLLEAEKANGSFSVYYNPEPENHNFMLQDLCIKSNDSTISATITNANDQLFSLTLSGYANQLKLSDNSLLPDFFNMFKDNDFLPPALLVTIIGGAITMVKLRKDKDDVQERKDEND